MTQTRTLLTTLPSAKALMTHCFGNPLTTALFSRLETHEPDPRNGRETPGRHQVHAFQGNPFGQALRRAREDGSFAINTAELDRYKAANEHRFQETRKEAASVSPLETPSDPVTETAIRGRLELEASRSRPRFRSASLSTGRGGLFSGFKAR